MQVDGKHVQGDSSEVGMGVLLLKLPGVQLSFQVSIDNIFERCCASLVPA